MIIASLRLRPATEMKTCFVSALREISALAEATPGCLDSCLLEAVEPNEMLLYIEQWSSDEDLKRHLMTESYRKLLSLMELSADMPELDFYNVVRHTGLDTVIQARQSA